MKRIILIALIIVSHSSFGQVPSDDYILKLDFAPSFMYGSHLTIGDSKGNSYVEISFLQYHNKDTSTFKNRVAVSDSSLSTLAIFLKTYKFQNKGNIDTIDYHKELINGDSVPIYSVSAGLDGITVGGELTQKGLIHHFAFWSPKDGTPNQKLMSLLFNIMYSSFKNDTSVNYIEQLEQYFPHQLGLKKLSDLPLKYKLYGSVTKNDSLQFDTFLSSLPIDAKVCIDMSNFSGMGTMFFPTVKKYCKNKGNIYWLNPSYTGLVDLYKIGIDKKYIISKKEIVKIKEKGGSETIITRQIDN